MSIFGDVWDNTGGKVVSTVADTGQSLVNGLTGFAYGGQYQAKQPGSYSNEVYNSANNNYQQNLASATGKSTGSNTPAQPTPTPTPTPQQSNQPTQAEIAAANARAQAEAAARAKAAEEARIKEAKRKAYGVNQNNYKSGAQTSLGDVHNEYDTKTREFWNQIGDSQGEINQSNAQNQLNLRKSMDSIVNGLRTGMRSGSVALAGMNASDSGAADAMARAYAKVANAQTDEARGQAMAEFEELQRSQGILNRTRTEGESDLGTWRDTEIGRVQQDFGSKLDALRANSEADGFNGIIDTSLVDQVVGEAMQQLQAIDQRGQGRAEGIKSWTPDQVVQEAIRMEQQGMAGNPFEVRGTNVNYGNGGPLRGASPTNVPIYLRNRDEQTLLPGRRNNNKE